MINYSESSPPNNPQQVNQSLQDVNIQIDDLLSEVEVLMFTTMQCFEDCKIFGSDILQDAAVYHLQTGGQRLRAKLALSAGYTVGLDESDCVRISAAVELLHNASLIHDDLQDGDLIRRGQASVWSKYGNQLAICLGDLYLSSAYSVLAKFSNSILLPQLFNVFHLSVSKATYGQVVDLTLLPEDMSLASYIEIAQAKSGALLSLPFELIFIANHQPQLIHLARLACQHFSVGYQIFDDFKDYPNDRVNIFSTLKLLESQSKNFVNPFAAAKEIAIYYLLESEAILGRLPCKSGFLLEQYSTEIRYQIEESNWTM